MKYEFGEFILDLDGRQLLGPSGAIRLSPQAFELLRLLVENRPRALSRRELHEQLWPSTFVLDANLAVLVSDLRAALSDTPRQPRFVRTVHRFGYAFAGDAHPLPSPAPVHATSNLCCWMVWENREFPLQAGENMIGRHPQAAVCFNIPGVSRHHARIHIADDVILEDLGSKNGTYVGGRRVTAPIRLVDGEDIRIGSLTLVFRSRPFADSTETQHGANLMQESGNQDERLARTRPLSGQPLARTRTSPSEAD